MLRQRGRVIVGAALALLLAACGPVGGDRGKGEGDQAGDNAPITDGGELIVALAEEPDMLDPTLSRTFVGRMVYAHMCEKLYDIDNDVNVVPQLAAELPEVSDDGLTATIKLREGLKFNDGTELNAEAVKTSLDRHRELEGSARASELSAVSAVEAVDEMTVRLTLSEPFSPLTATLADRSGMIMSPAQLQKLGENFADEPVCVGPFTFVERVAQDRIVLEKSEHYYDADQVHLDRVVFRAVTDGNIRLANLRSGDVHVIDRIDTNLVAQAEADANLTTIAVTGLGYQAVDFNVGNANGLPPAPPGRVDTPMAQHPELRQAFSLAMDRDQLNQVVFNGLYEPACSPVPPHNPLAPPQASQCPKRDLDEAKRLIQSTGVPTPIRFEMIINTDTEGRRIGEAIQSMAAEAGFQITLRPVEFAASLDESDAGRYEAFQIGWSGRVDPDGNLYNFHATDGSQNITRPPDQGVDALLQQGRAEQDPDRRRELYAELLDLLNERANIVYLWNPKNYTGVTRTVRGVEVRPDGLIRVIRAGFTDSQ